MKSGPRAVLAYFLTLYGAMGAIIGLLALDLHYEYGIPLAVSAVTLLLLVSASMVAGAVGMLWLHKSRKTGPPEH